MYDVIVIGAGPAGLTAAIYAARAEKKVLLLEKETFGGQITASPQIENYPGFQTISGNQLAEQMVEQVLALGVDVEPEEVLGIREEGRIKYVRTEQGEHATRSVVIATGAKHRQLGLPGEDRLIGEGVSYCAVCDGAFYKGKTIAIIGGGNTALQEAALLSESCPQVYVIQNLPTLTGEAKLAAALKDKENVRIIYETVVAELVGERTLRELVLRHTVTGELTRLAVDGMFVAIGQVPANRPFADTVALNEQGYILADERCLTDRAGIFVAGDCRTKAVRQITTATADGATAALAAVHYLSE
ncbi:MAG: FAD-dependent oxidoreductase [Eubacteriales bacterium]